MYCMYMYVLIGPLGLGLGRFQSGNKCEYKSFKHVWAVFILLFIRELVPGCRSFVRIRTFCRCRSLLPFVGFDGCELGRWGENCER